MARPTVLLVDDVPELRLLVRVNLEQDGRFDIVGEAENGREAVECAEKHQPDLVLLDVSMPVQDGMESLPQIRAVAPEAKVVMLSGFEERRLAVMAYQLGAIRYLEKGITPDELVEELVQVLAA